MTRFNYLALLREFHPRQLMAFLGRRTAAWFALGLCGSLLLAFMEAMMASFLQIFLKGLGLLSPGIAIGGPFRDLNATPTNIGIVLVSIGLFRFIGQYLVLYGGSAVQEHMTFRLRERLLTRVLIANDKGQVPASECNHYFGQCFLNSGYMCGVLLQGVSLALQACALLALMFYVSPAESAVGTAGLLVIGVLSSFIVRRVRIVANRIPIENRAVNGGIIRVARNWMLLKVLKTEGLEYARMFSSVEKLRNFTLEANSRSHFASALTPFLGIILLFLVILVSQHTFKTPAIALVSFLYLFVRFVQGLAGLVAMGGGAVYYAPHFREAFHFYFSVKDKKYASPECTLTPTAEALAPEVTFEDVDLSHGSQAIVRGLTIRLAPGQQLGLVGPSGSGKSTILAALLGLLAPSRGVVKVGGVVAARILTDKILRVGYVGPEPFLFAGTIRENLVYGCGDHSEQDVHAALGLANMADVINGFPGRLETKLTENGEGLSAGQKQRLCLARVFLAKPSLIILDEVTANLDVETERGIVESIHSLAGIATVVFVSHRLSALKYADTIFDLGSHVKQE